MFKNKATINELHISHKWVSFIDKRGVGWLKAETIPGTNNQTVSNNLWPKYRNPPLHLSQTIQAHISGSRSF